MEISQHIKNLLITNERVILGGFGAFDSKHIPARIDKETKTMTPPFKIVVFNPDFKEAEGLLAKHMAEKEGISFDNANEQISEYVKTIKTKLDAGETVVFKDLGEFKKTDDGKYDFSYRSEDNLLVDSFGLPKVSLSEQEQAKTVPNKNLRKEPIKKREPIKKVPEKKPVKKESVKQKTKPAPIKKDAAKKTPPVKKQKPVKLKKEGAKKKKVFLPILLIIIGIIGIFLVAVYFFKPDLWMKGYSYSSEKIASVKKSIFGSNGDDLEIITPDNDQTEEIADNNTETEEQVSDASDNTESAENIEDNQTEDISAEDTEDAQSENIKAEDNTQTENIQEETEQEVPVNTNTSSAQNGKYYIIIGSVKTEASAQKEQKRYAKRGISTDIIYVPHMERYRISIGNFSSAKAAQDFFSDFQNKYGSIDAWVWEKR